MRTQSTGIRLTFKPKTCMITTGITTTLILRDTCIIPQKSHNSMDSFTSETKLMTQGLTSKLILKIMMFRQTRTDSVVSQFLWLWPRLNLNGMVKMLIFLIMKRSMMICLRDSMLSRRELNRELSFKSVKLMA